MGSTEEDTNDRFSSDAAVTSHPGIPYFTPQNNSGAALDPSSPSTPTLFRPLKIRSVTLKNRIMVAPMCMYSCSPDPKSPSIGALTDYHLVHLGHFALKGAGLVMIEATSVTPNGRISPGDSGLWQFDQGSPTTSEQFKGIKRVADFVHAQGSVLAIQLAHAGRKASTAAKWLPAQYGAKMLRADESVGGWPTDVVAPTGGLEMRWSRDGYWEPREMSTEEVEDVVQAFAKSAELAVQAGVDVIEIHAAHGYLLHQFLSPVTNRRTDKYGGSFENRIRVIVEIARAIREVIPETTPLFIRLSATEWLEDSDIATKAGGSWDIPSTLKLAKLLPNLGIDLLDVSSGGNHEKQKIEPHSNYQIGIAGDIRKELRDTGINDLLIGAVGFITEARGAKEIVEGAQGDSGGKPKPAPMIQESDAIKEEARGTEEIVKGREPKADAVLVARQFMREPEWVMKVAKELGVQITGPCQFERAGLF